MAGSKRAKLRRVFSNTSTPSPPTNVDDQDLMDDLIAQLDSKDKQVQAQSATVLNEIQLNKQMDSQEKRDAKSRFKARQAKKAVALAQSYPATDPETEARLQKEADLEEKNINRICDELRVQIHEIEPDGHCLYSAVADQLALLAILPPSQAHYGTTRLAASNYIYSHPHDFLPFLSSGDEDGPGPADTGLMTPGQFEKYCMAIRDTAVWGGEPEILALSKAFNVPIHVVQSGSPPVVEHNPSGAPPGSETHSRVARISYHRRMYGLGEHYNSLRPKSGLSKISSSIQSILS